MVLLVEHIKMDFNSNREYQDFDQDYDEHDDQQDEIKQLPIGAKKFDFSSKSPSFWYLKDDKGEKNPNEVLLLSKEEMRNYRQNESIIIQQVSIGKDGENIYRYYLFSGIQELNQYDLERENLHEVALATQPRRIILDLDMELKEKLQPIYNQHFKGKPLRETADIIACHIINEATSIINEYYFQHLDYELELYVNEQEIQDERKEYDERRRNPRVSVYCRHRASKFSFHVIYTSNYVASYKQMKEFNRLIKDAIREKYPHYLPLFDAGMDKSTLHFAMPLCMNKGHTLLPADGDFRNVFNSTCKATSINGASEEPKYRYGCDHWNLEDNLFTVFDVNKLEEVRFPLKEADYKNGEMDMNMDEKMILEAFNEKFPEIAKFHMFDRRAGNILMFKRHCSSFCSICERNHDKDNTLRIVQTRTGIYWTCQRKFKMLPENLILQTAKLTRRQILEFAIKRSTSKVLKERKFITDTTEYNKPEMSAIEFLPRPEPEYGNYELEDDEKAYYEQIKKKQEAEDEKFEKSFKWWEEERRKKDEENKKNGIEPEKSIHNPYKIHFADVKIDMDAILKKIEEEPELFEDLPAEQEEADQQAEADQEEKPVDMDKYIPLSSILMLKANKGVGKTKAVIDYIKKNPQIKRIGYISFRKTLSASMKKRFNDEGLGFISYLDANAKGQYRKPISDERWICQVESLHRIDHCSVDLLVIDEITQVVKQFFSDTMKQKLNDCFSKFSALIKYSKKVCVMDADINRSTYDTLRFISPNSVFRLHHNQYQKPYNVSATTDETDIMRHIMDALKQDKRIAICSNHNPYKLQAIDERIKKEFPEKKTILYTQQTNRKKEISDTLNDVNTEWLKYDVVLYSPTIQAGLSFEQKHFDYCYGIFNNSSSDDADCCQMIHRIRDVEHIFICFNIMPVRYYPTELADIEEFITTQRRNLMFPSNIKYELLPDGAKSYPFKDAFYQIWIRHLSRKYFSHQNFMNELITREVSAGAVFHLMPETNATKKEKKEMRDELLKATDEAKLADCAVIAETKNPIDPLDFDNLTDEVKEILREKNKLGKSYDVLDTIDEKTADWFATYGKERSKDLFKNLRVGLIVGDEPDEHFGINELRKEEQAKLAERWRNRDTTEVKEEYKYNRHQFAFSLLRACGFKDLMDDEELDSGYYELKTTKKRILNLLPEKDLKHICHMFERRPITRDAIEKWDTKPMLAFVNSIFSKMYGVKIKAKRNKRKNVSGYYLDKTEIENLFEFDVENKKLLTKDKD